MGDKTSIQISVDTKDQLAKLGTKADTYDSVIHQLLKTQKNRG